MGDCESTPWRCVSIHAPSFLVRRRLISKWGLRRGRLLAELLWIRRRSLYPAECILQTIGKASSLQVSRLVKEADRSCIHCPRLYSVVGIGGYENERNVESEMRQMLLQLEAAHVRHLYVGYQTGGFLHP